MKTVILILAGVCVVGGVMIYLGQRGSKASQSTDSTIESVATTTEQEPARAAAVPDQKNLSKPEPRERSSASYASAPRPGSVASADTLSLPFQQAINTLLSGQATYDQKQAAWKQIRDSGKMDQLISELEQRASANPNSAEYPATLGQAYLHKAGMLQDIREQGILGMKADQSFDAALNLDAANWEAGFWKAAALSYWPPQLGKGQEVIERFVELVKLQESQQTQPQFAQTYLLLGEQYRKQGYPDYAKQTWQRGATLFPNDSKLAEKLTQSQVPQTEER